MTSMLVWIFLAIMAKVQGGKSIWNSNGSILINQRAENNTIDSSSRIIFDVTNEYLVDNLTAGEESTSYFSDQPKSDDLMLKVTVSPPIRVPGIQTSSNLTTFANLSDAYATVFHSKYSFFFYMVYSNSTKFLKEYFVAEARKTAQPHVSLVGWSKGMSADTACPSFQNLIHIMESTQAEVILICAQSLPNSGTQIKLAFYECSSYSCMTQMFASTVDTPKLRQEISITPSVGIRTLRAIRLEMNSTILNDTVFWSDKTDSMYYVNELSGLFRPINIKMNISNVRALRSQFLLITVDDRAFDSDVNLTDPSDRVTNYLISYPPPGPMRLTRLMESVNLCINEPAKIHECTMAKIPRRFLGFYYMSSEDETLFEFDSDKEYPTPGRRPTQLIDVYRFQMATGKFEKIVEAWAEKNDSGVSRFTSQTYFIQVLPKVIDNTTTTVQVSLSPRRYKAATRSALELKISRVIQPSEMFQYFDHNFKILYLVAGPEMWAIPIEPARLQIQVQPWNKSDTGSRPIPVLPEWISKDFRETCTKYTVFDLAFGNIQNSRNVSTQVVCLNVSLQAGTFFFNPTRTNTLTTNTTEESPGKFQHFITENLPIGTIKEVDFPTILQGSFMKLVANNQTSVSEVTNNYLDNYVYKLYFRKSKFLESIYGFETYDGDERKISFAISTTYENYFYVTNRFQRDLTQSQVDAKKVKMFSLRDYRVLTRFEPINSTSVLVQVEDLTYIVDVKTNNDAPDFPSRGANGVCSNNTILRHNTMGKLMLCVYETKVYIRILNSDFGIFQISTTSEVENILKSIRQLKFMRSSSHFENYVFLFYHVKQDPTLSIDTKDDLAMAILILDNVAKPTLSLVQLRAQYRRIRYGEGELNTIPAVHVQEIAIAGDKLVALEKYEGATIETYYAVYSFSYLFQPAFEYFVQLPTDQLTILPNPQLYVTNVMSELESGEFLNSVVSYQRNLFQVSMKVQMTFSKEMKILVFNPFALPYDSLSFIELPPGYMIVDLGPTTHLTKKKEYSSLCILGAYTNKLDDQFFSQEPPVYIFLINDLTPTITFKPFKSPELLIDSKNTFSGNNITFSFNMTSSLYSERFLEENKHKIQRMTFDLTPKSFTMNGSHWGSSFSARGNSKFDTSRNITTVTSDLELDSSKYKRPTELDDFYFRLDPAQYIKGGVVTFSGLPQSSVEDYMGIVKVLSNHNTSNILRYGHKKIKPENETYTSSFLLHWDCTRVRIDQEAHNVQTSARKVWACQTNSDASTPTTAADRIIPLVSFKSKIFRVQPTWNMTEFSRFFPDYSSGFVPSGRYLYYFKQNTTVAMSSTPTNQVIFLCVDFINETLHDLTVDGSNACKKPFKIADFNSGDQLELLVFKGTDSSIAVIREYNYNLMIYTQVAYYQIKAQGNENVTQPLKGPEYISSDHLATIVMEKSNESLALNVYFRWRNEDHLTLIIAWNNLSNATQQTKKFVIPLLSFTKSFDSLYSLSHDIQIFTPKLKNASEKYTIPGQVDQEYLPIIISFRRANSYLMYVNLETMRSKIDTGASINETLGGIQIPLNDTYLAAISNPFFGFTPESDSPEPEFYTDYFFRVVNFKERSYLLSYHLKPEALRRYPDIQNIFGIDKDPHLNGMNTAYDSKGDYIYTTSVITLKDRPISMMVIPNAFPTNDLEHQLVYVSRQHELFEMNFTSYMNVRVKTFRLASRMLTLNVSGVLNQNVSVTLNFKGFRNTSFLDDLSNTVRLIFLSAIALGLTVVLMIFIDKDVKTTQGENHRVLLRHSLKPITNAIGNFISVVDPEVDKPASQKQTFEESDDSDEAVEVCASLIKEEAKALRNREPSNKFPSEKAIKRTEREMGSLGVPEDSTQQDPLSSALTSDNIRSRRSMRPTA